jgi:Alpha/beta hydrolase domain
VRRYYIPSTQHGGGPGGFSTTPLAKAECPSIGYGHGTLAINPMPHTQTVNTIRVHFRNWVMKGIVPPPSRYPTLAGGMLVDATSEAMGFPAIPGLPAHAPTGLINPVIDTTSVMSSAPSTARAYRPWCRPASSRSFG